MAGFLPATPIPHVHSRSKEEFRASFHSGHGGRDRAARAGAAPAQANTRVQFVAPARSYQLEGVCPFTISAQERDGHPGFLTFNDKGEVVQVEFGGSFRHGALELAR